MSVLADPKRAPRKVDRKAVAQARQLMRGCLCCGWHWVEAHHLIHRSQGGDDLPENLVSLCSRCHGALHGSPYVVGGKRIIRETVMKAIGRFLRSDAGREHRRYILHKLGLKRGEAYLERYL